MATNDYAKEWYYKNHEENKKKKREYAKKWRDSNLARVRERNRVYALKWRAANKDKTKKTREKISTNLTEIDKENRRQYDREYKKKKRAENSETKLKANYRTRINNALRRARVGKPTNTDFLLGCSIFVFMNHLKNLFEPWMSFENYGKASKVKRTWNVDHVIPVSLFDLTNPEECKKAFHYTNTKPMEAIANCAKGSKLI